MFWMIVLSFVLMKKKRIRCYLSAGNPAPRPVLCPSLCLCRGEKSLSPYLKAQRKMHNRGRALSLLVTKVSLRRGEASCPTLLAGGPGCLDSPSLPPPSLCSRLNFLSACQPGVRPLRLSPSLLCRDIFEPTSIFLGIVTSLSPHCDPGASTTPRSNFSRNVSMPPLVKLWLI